MAFFTLFFVPQDPAANVTPSKFEDGRHHEAVQVVAGVADSRLVLDCTQKCRLLAQRQSLQKQLTLESLLDALTLTESSKILRIVVSIALETRSWHLQLEKLQSVVSSECLV